MLFWIQKTFLFVVFIHLSIIFIYFWFLKINLIKKICLFKKNGVLHQYSLLLGSIYYKEIFTCNKYIK